LRKNRKETLYAGRLLENPAELERKGGKVCRDWSQKPGTVRGAAPPSGEIEGRPVGEQVRGRGRRGRFLRRRCEPSQYLEGGQSFLLGVLKQEKKGEVKKREKTQFD